MKTLKIVSIFIFRHWKHYLWKIGKNNPEIANLEFENQKNINFSIFRRVVRARKKIYLYRYYLGFFKICPSFNNPAEIVLIKVHMVHCIEYNDDTGLPAHCIGYRFDGAWQILDSSSSSLLLLAGTCQLVVRG